MIISFKNRKINIQKQVRIYRNLRGDFYKKYSILQNSLVVGHTNTISLKNCRFVVRLSGQQKVREQKKKNVHAFIVGKITNRTNKYNRKITYNPYKNEEFVDNFGRPIQKSKFVKINNKGVFV